MKTPQVNLLKPIVKSVLAVLLLALLCVQVNAATGSQHDTLFAAANYLELNNGETKAFIGNGFILNHQGKRYAVTAKHVLFELRSPLIPHINIDHAVSAWRLKPFNSHQPPVTLGPLVNHNRQERLDMKVLEQDYLLFHIAGQNDTLQGIELSPHLPLKGDKLIAYGCSYANQQTCKQNQYVGHFVESDGNNLRIKLIDHQPGQLRGLSGAPVLNEQGKLVGIVSNVLPAKDGDGHDFAPANLIYLNKILEDLAHHQG